MDLLAHSPLTTFGSAVSLAVYFGTVVHAGSARGKAGLKPPAMTGDLGFECANRVHQNTLEQLIVFLPALWLARGSGAADVATAGAALAWSVSRAIYGYFYPAGTRAVGAIPSFLLSIGLIGYTGVVSFSAAIKTL